MTQAMGLYIDTSKRVGENNDASNFALTEQYLRGSAPNPWYVGV